MARERYRIGGERGSALLLVPAGFLALVVLATLAFDQARVFGARRELLDVAASAANDVAAVALDRSAYYEGGRVATVQQRGEALVAEELAARGLEDRVRARVAVRESGGGPEVVVKLETEVASVFGRAAPGGWRRTAVRVSASATLDIF